MNSSNHLMKLLVPCMLVPCMLLLGCDAPLEPGDTEDRSQSGESMRRQSVRSGPIRLAVELIAGAEGSQLQAGGAGWMSFSLVNESDRTAFVHTAAWAGKGRPVERASLLPDGWPDGFFYSGFGVAELSYVFLPETGEGAIGEPRRLSPPDGRVTLDPGEKRWFRRRIQAPTTSGAYRLQLTFNNDEAIAALLTSNNCGLLGDSVHTTFTTRAFPVVAP